MMVQSSIRDAIMESSHFKCQYRDDGHLRLQNAVSAENEGGSGLEKMCETYHSAGKILKKRRPCCKQNLLSSARLESLTFFLDRGKSALTTNHLNLNLAQPNRFNHSHVHRSYLTIF